MSNTARILNAIREFPGEKVRTIAILLGLTRRDINSALYGELQDSVYQDSQFCWHLRKGGTLRQHVAAEAGYSSNLSGTHALPAAQKSEQQEASGLDSKAQGTVPPTDITERYRHEAVKRKQEAANRTKRRAVRKRAEERRRRRAAERREKEEQWQLDIALEATLIGSQLITSQREIQFYRAQDPPRSFLPVLSRYYNGIALAFFADEAIDCEQGEWNIDGVPAGGYTIHRLGDQARKSQHSD